MAVKVTNDSENKSYDVCDIRIGEVGILTKVPSSSIVLIGDVVVGGQNEILFLASGTWQAKRESQEYRYRKLRPGEKVEITAD